MEVISLNQRLLGISHVIVSKYSLSPTFASVIVKSAKMALRSVTLKEYNEGHVEEMIRILRSATKIQDDEIMQELNYEFAWALTQKTIIPVLQADMIAREFFPVILEEIADSLYAHNIDALFEYLEIDHSISNRKALKRQEVMESAKREFMDGFERMKQVG